LADNWYTGNAEADGDSNRGWLLGHFLPDDADTVRSTKALEVKWGVHAAGERRAGWTAGERRTTMVILIEGRHRVDLTVGSVVLAKRGDYVVWGPGIDHTWEAERDSTVLTVRWPSLVP
jgi:quercetin dioxygenase-like cupin family protein